VNNKQLQRLRKQLLDALVADGGAVAFFELMLVPGIPDATPAFRVRDALQELRGEALVSTQPDVGPDHWRALPAAFDAAAPVLEVSAGVSRLTPQQAAALDGLIAQHYAVGGVNAVLERTRGVRPERIRQRAWRLRVRAP